MVQFGSPCFDKEVCDGDAQGFGRHGGGRRPEASTEAASAAKVGQLEDELARLKLVCAAVWELMRERAKLTENDLLAKVAEIDGRDGVIDGKLVRPVRISAGHARAAPCRRAGEMHVLRDGFCGQQRV